jgi:hypothetical protein
LTVRCDEQIDLERTVSLVVVYAIVDRQQSACCVETL